MIKCVLCLRGLCWEPACPCTAYILCQNNDTTRGNNMRREQRQQEENIKYK